MWSILGIRELTARGRNPQRGRNIDRSSVSNQADRVAKVTDIMVNRSEISPSVTLESVSHQFGARCVFRDISCSIASGEVLVVSGANGSGKSTLLRVVAGLLTPTSGAVTIRVEGALLDGFDRRRQIGFVAPDLVLYRELTGAENLQFFAELHGITLDRTSTVDLLSRVGLRGRGRDLAGSYSSGMRQRLKYAFALLHTPPILILDEPTANLDAEGIEVVEGIVDNVRNRDGGGLVIVATNEPRELEWSRLQIHLGAGE